MISHGDLVPTENSIHQTLPQNCCTVLKLYFNLSVDICMLHSVVPFPSVFFQSAALSVPSLLALLAASLSSPFPLAVSMSATAWDDEPATQVSGVRSSEQHA
jgi:hypothetical protein